MSALTSPNPVPYSVREVACVEHCGTHQGLCLGHCLCCLPVPRVSPAQALCPLWLQVITLEGWVEIMYYVMDAHSFYNFIYFILLIIVSVMGVGALQAASRTCGLGAGVCVGLWESPGSPSEPGELRGREQEGQFKCSSAAGDQRDSSGAAAGRIHHLRLSSFLISGM